MRLHGCPVVPTSGMASDPVIPRRDSLVPCVALCGMLAAGPPAVGAGTHTGLQHGRYGQPVPGSAGTPSCAEPHFAGDLTWRLPDHPKQLGGPSGCIQDGHGKVSWAAGGGGGAWPSQTPKHRTRSKFQCSCKGCRVLRGMSKCRHVGLCGMCMQPQGHVRVYLRLALILGGSCFCCRGLRCHYASMSDTRRASGVQDVNDVFLLMTHVLPLPPSCMCLSCRTPEDTVDATLRMHFRRRTLKTWVGAAKTHAYADCPCYAAGWLALTCCHHDVCCRVRSPQCGCAFSSADCAVTCSYCSQLGQFRVQSESQSARHSRQPVYWVRRTHKGAVPAFCVNTVTPLVLVCDACADCRCRICQRGARSCCGGST